MKYEMAIHSAEPERTHVEATTWSIEELPLAIPATTAHPSRWVGVVVALLAGIVGLGFVGRLDEEVNQSAARQPSASTSAGPSTDAFEPADMASRSFQPTSPAERGALVTHTVLMAITLGDAVIGQRLQSVPGHSTTDAHRGQPRRPIVGPAVRVSIRVFAPGDEAEFEVDRLTP